MTLDKKSISRILIIQPRGLGDVVLSTVVANNVHREFPGARIDYLVHKPNQTALEKIPFINEVISYKREEFKGGLKALLTVRKNRYDLVIDLYCTPRTALDAFMSGAAWRAGRKLRWRGFAYNVEIPIETSPLLHQVQRHIQFLKALGVGSDSTEVFFGRGEDDIGFADTFFGETFETGQLVVGISPGGNWPARKCDPVKLTEIGDAILDTYHTQLLLIWGPGERDEINEIRSLMRNPVVLAPPTDIRQMGALISRCSLFISNNSGPMHISVAVGTPVLSIAGPVDPVRQGPYGDAHGSVRLDELDCIGCNLKVCSRNHECFLQLPVSRVMDALASIIEKNGIPLLKK